MGHLIFHQYLAKKCTALENPVSGIFFKCGADHVAHPSQKYENFVVGFHTSVVNSQHDISHFARRKFSGNIYMWEILQASHTGQIPHGRTYLRH